MLTKARQVRDEGKTYRRSCSLWILLRSLLATSPKVEVSGQSRCQSQRQWKHAARANTHTHTYICTQRDSNESFVNSLVVPRVRAYVTNMRRRHHRVTAAHPLPLPLLSPHALPVLSSSLREQKSRHHRRQSGGNLSMSMSYVSTTLFPNCFVARRLLNETRNFDFCCWRSRCLRLPRVRRRQAESSVVAVVVSLLLHLGAWPACLPAFLPGPWANAFCLW